MSLPEEDSNTDWTFKYAVEGILIPVILSLGLLGNSLSIYILRQKEVKLQGVLVEVLCSLTVFDSLFLIGAFLLYSLPQLSVSYANYTFHLVAPYLYPITNTLLTCSSYMTVVVIANKYLLIGKIIQQKRSRLLLNRYMQLLMVSLAAISVNIPRWLEFSCCNYGNRPLRTINKTSGEIMTRNITTMYVVINPIRDQYEYIRDYTLISSNLLTLLFPMILMSIFAGLIYREMEKSTSLVSSDFHESDGKEQERRNRSLTFVLIGIIILFIVCRIGELGISVYELIMIIREGERKSFPEYIRAIISINSLLLVCNSSFNFIIYYKDMLFRRCFLKLYYTLSTILGKKQNAIQEHEDITLQDMGPNLL
jgi:hypothetical protein